MPSVTPHRDDRPMPETPEAVIAAAQADMDCNVPTPDLQSLLETQAGLARLWQSKNKKLNLDERAREIIWNMALGLDLLGWLAITKENL